MVNPTLFARVPYDPIKDFDPVTLAVASTTVLTVNPSVPAKTVKELVDLIKANPGKYSFGSAGAGTQAHLAGEQFRLSLGLDLVHVPFGGGGPAVAAVVAGHTPISFVSPQAAMQHVREGTVRALAVTSKTRSQIFPNVPTMAEAGYPEIEGDGWVGILVPAGTPAEIIAILYRDSAKILAQPDMKERLAALGYDVVASTPKEFAADGEAERLRGLEIDGELELGRLLDGKIARLRALENFVHVARGATIQVRQAGPVRGKPALRDELGLRIDGWQFARECERCHPVAIAE